MALCELWMRWAFGADSELDGVPASFGLVVLESRYVVDAIVHYILLGPYGGSLPTITTTSVMWTAAHAYVVRAYK